MKMPEKHDLLARHSRSKEQNIGAILAFTMAYLRGRYNGGAFTKNSNRRNDVRHYQPSSFVTFLDFAGLVAISLITKSVFISYINLSIGSLIKRLNATTKKPGKVVEINNQRKAFLDMYGVVGGN